MGHAPKGVAWELERTAISLRSAPGLANRDTKTARRSREISFCRKARRTKVGERKVSGIERNAKRTETEKR